VEINLKGQVAIVTGANSGIGEGIARAMAEAGATVVINYVSRPEEAEKIVAEIRERGGKASSAKADVSDEQQVVAMFEAVRREFGTVDILVNNAGIQKDAAIQDMTLEQWQQVIDVNLTGQFLCAREAVREFLRRDKSDLSKALGKIICISSVHQEIPWAGHANYAASKGGIKLLMETLAQELAPQRIRVNAIAPGAIKTPINHDAWSTPEAEKQLLKLIPYGRVGTTDDIAKAAVWLASDESDYVTGATLFVDGGMSLFPGFRTGG
jgi:glucose 1-dehydrogenase